MPGCVRVFSGVTVRRAITAERLAARLAGAQMDPVCADLHAFLAFAPLRLFNGRDRVKMRAASIRHYNVSLFRVANTRNVLVISARFLRMHHGGTDEICARQLHVNSTDFGADENAKRERTDSRAGEDSKLPAQSTASLRRGKGEVF